MLTSAIATLQNLLSTRFIVGNFFPALAFWFANAVMLFSLNGSFRQFATNSLNNTLPFSAVILAATVIGVAMSAYALSAVLPAVQAVLEGQWPAWLIWLFAPSQMRRFETVTDRMNENSKLRGSFGNTIAGRTQAELWGDWLLEARREGTTTAPDVNNYRRGADSAKAIQKLANRRRRAQPISVNQITKVVTPLVFDLRTNNADLPGIDNDLALDKMHVLLLDLIDYAEKTAIAQYRQLLNLRRFSFGLPPTAPTAMGNVAKTIQAYAVRRYNMNFEFFYSRFQPLWQKDPQFGPLLQSVRTQMDFLISAFLLTAVWSILWGLWLFATGGPVQAFLIAALVGPIVSVAWYQAAVVHYRTLADVLRTGIDLFRFELLKQLSLPVPTGVQEEYQLWENADALHSLYQLDDIRYVLPKSS